MFSYPVLKQFQRNKLHYHYLNNKTIKAIYDSRQKDGTYHKLAMELKKSWFRMSGMYPTLTYMWERLEYLIKEIDYDLYKEVAEICRSGSLRDASNPEDVMTDLAYLLAGEALENGGL